MLPIKPDKLNKLVQIIKPSIAVKTEEPKKVKLIYLKASRKYVEVHHTEGMLNSVISLRTYHKNYPQLIMVHRNTLVNRNYIQSVLKTDNGKIVLKLFGIDELLPISRRNIPNLRKIVKDREKENKENKKNA